MPKKLMTSIALLLSLISLMTSISVAQDAEDEDPLQVVATFSILGDIVQNVAGDNIELTVLVGTNADTHTFEPNPSDAAAISNADLLFENGFEFETFLDDLFEASGSQARRIVVSEGIDVIAFDEGEDHDDEGEDHDDEGEDHDDEGEEDAHGHGEVDPHWWGNPLLAITVVENVRDALIEAQPDNAETYMANAGAYIEQLEETDTFIREQIDTLPEESRILVTSHDTFGYFGEAYDFTVLSVLESISTATADPSPRELTELMEEIQALNVPALFAENITNPDLIELVAVGSNAVVAPPLFTDALGDTDSQGATYLDMLRYNARTIVQALEG